MHDEFDRGSKWLIQHHGDSILRLGRIGPIRTWRAVAAEVVQPKRLPDGLLEAFLGDRQEADLFVAEIATYPEPRVPQQMMDDTLLVWMDRRVLPEVVTVVLCPRGAYHVPDHIEVTSRLGLTRVAVNWRIVELWTLPAEDCWRRTTSACSPGCP